MTILPVQVLDSSGLGQDSDIVQGIVWAADNGANVILMSFSNPGYSQALQDAISYAWGKGAVVVAATGNDGVSTPTYPAGDADVMGVAGTDQSDQPWASSNTGADTFLAAPATSIPADATDGSETSITGTSASAAMVAGAAALLMANDPLATNAIVDGRLARNADPVGTADQTGNGRLNVARAFADTSTDPVTPLGAPGGGPHRRAVPDREQEPRDHVRGNRGRQCRNHGYDATRPQNMTCTGSPNPCTVSLGNNDVGTLTATPNATSTFAGWSARQGRGSPTRMHGHEQPLQLQHGEQRSERHRDVQHHHADLDGDEPHLAGQQHHPEDHRHRPDWIDGQALHEQHVHERGRRQRHGRRLRVAGNLRDGHGEHEHDLLGHGHDRREHICLLDLERHLRGGLDRADGVELHLRAVARPDERDEPELLGLLLGVGDRLLRAPGVTIGGTSSSWSAGAVTGSRFRPVHLHRQPRQPEQRRDPDDPDRGGRGPDLAGNSSTASNTVSYTIDTTPPTASLSCLPSANPSNSTSFNCSVTFSESVSGFSSTTSDVTIGGTSSNWTKGASSGSGAGPYTFTVSRGAPNTDGTLTIQVAAGAAQDAATNNNTASNTVTYTIDTTPPTASLSCLPSANPSNSTSFNCSVTFSESVSGFDSTTSDVTIGGTSSNWTKGASSGSGAGPYTFTVSRGAPNTDGSLTIQVAAGAAQDAATNNNTASNTVSYTIDTTPPTASLSCLPARTRPTAPASTARSPSASRSPASTRRRATSRSAAPLVQAGRRAPAAAAPARTPSPSRAGPHTTAAHDPGRRRRRQTSATQHNSTSTPSATRSTPRSDGDVRHDAGEPDQLDQRLVQLPRHRPDLGRRHARRQPPGVQARRGHLHAPAPARRPSRVSEGSHTYSIRAVADNAGNVGNADQLHLDASTRPTRRRPSTRRRRPDQLDQRLVQLPRHRPDLGRRLLRRQPPGVQARRGQLRAPAPARRASPRQAHGLDHATDRRNRRRTGDARQRERIYCDDSAPTATVTFPVSGNVYNAGGWNAGCATAGLCGTASDFESGPGEIDVAIKDTTSGKWYDGTGFYSNSQTFLITSRATQWGHYALELRPERLEADRWRQLFGHGQDGSTPPAHGATDTTNPHRPGSPPRRLRHDGNVAPAVRRQRQLRHGASSTLRSPDGRTDASCLPRELVQLRRPAPGDTVEPAQSYDSARRERVDTPVQTHLQPQRTTARSDLGGDRVHPD